jgi:mannitol/fructose-specific phosphotransferase system IIA component (Ntr-type)
VPHCKSDAVSSNSIGILKPKRPIEWGSLDGEPVRMVIVLALREVGKNGSHMQVFSRLARKLMDEEFRDRLLSADDPASLVSQLGQELDAAV